jgi:copper chaperone CopZ
MIKSIKINVQGMKCGGCEMLVSNQIKTLSGIISVNVSNKEKTVQVEFDSEQTSESAIKSAITAAGYQVADSR